MKRIKVVLEIELEVPDDTIIEDVVIREPDYAYCVSDPNDTEYPILRSRKRDVFAL